jgi:hypothetical protein
VPSVRLHIPAFGTLTALHSCRGPILHLQPVPPLPLLLWHPLPGTFECWRRSACSVKGRWSSIEQLSCDRCSQGIPTGSPVVPRRLWRWRCD